MGNGKSRSIYFLFKYFFKITKFVLLCCRTQGLFGSLIAGSVHSIS